MIEIDQINSVLYESYILGNSISSLNSNPCSICREYIQSHPTEDKVNRMNMDEVHFHGSEFNMCERKLFHTYVSGIQMSFTDAAFLNDGHLHEQMILNSIYKGLPHKWKIKIFKNGQESIRGVLGYNLVTHMDAIIETPDEEYIGLECKSVKDKNFKKYENGEIDNIWFGQAQSYMFVNNIDKFYFLIKNRDNGKLQFPCLVNRSQIFIAERLNLLQEVRNTIEATKKGYAIKQPNRKHQTSKNVECQFCAYQLDCWNDK